MSQAGIIVLSDTVFQSNLSVPINGLTDIIHIFIFAQFFTNFTTNIGVLTIKQTEEIVLGHFLVSNCTVPNF